MKKMRTVPYSVLSADREIERMRELLTSGRDLEIDADGTISAIGASAASNREEKAKTVPVSYTHLDVYKRQTLYSVQVLYQWRH